MTDNRPEGTTKNYAANMTMAVLAAQSGCFSLVIVFGALFLGLWLDAQFGQRGPFTLGLLLLSVPISLFLMVRTAVSAVARIRPPETTRPPARRRATDEEEE
jgi:hypothetical protein